MDEPIPIHLRILGLVGGLLVVFPGVLIYCRLKKVDHPFLRNELYVSRVFIVFHGHFLVAVVLNWVRSEGLDLLHILVVCCVLIPLVFSIRHIRRR